MSMRYKGATLSSTAPVTTGGEDGTAPGAWTLEQQAQAQAAGLWPIPPQPKYVEDVFSTWLYDGNGTTQTITNGIDLSTYGGLVWQKDRTQALNNRVTDTVRGATKTLITDSITDQQNYAGGLTSFNSNGFSIGTDGAGNNSGDTFASWTFRKQPKFFDIQEWTGNATNRTIAHNLGSVPGSIWVKRRDASGAWQVYHRSLANTQYLVLNSNAAAATNANRWNSTTPTSTEFSLGTDVTVNASGGTYVAYIFAHNAGGFGLTGTDNVISCGDFTTDASGNATVNLGYEPQYILMKLNVNGAVNWVTYDIMRGWGLGNVAQLYPNITQVEDVYTGVPYFFPTATGFVLNGTFGLGNNQTNAYIAIRRGPMKTPTVGTSVFNPNTSVSTLSSGKFGVTTGFPVDMLFWRLTDDVSSSLAKRGLSSRLTGSVEMQTDTTNAEASNSAPLFDYSTQVAQQSGNPTFSQIFLSFQRAPNFFDVVCYTGTGTAMTVTHNLGVVPELIIVKRRDSTSEWKVYTTATGNGNELVLNSSGAVSATDAWNDTSPTASVFSIGSPIEISSATYVAYLFATCAGVSKVGSYTGTGTTLQINCGFTGGARFVLIKRSDNSGSPQNWYVWDSARGIVAGNDPYLLLNSTAAEVTNTDYIDTTAQGLRSAAQRQRPSMQAVVASSSWLSLKDRT
jgi:hypothetical protein